MKPVDPQLLEDLAGMAPSANGRANIDTTYRDGHRSAANWQGLDAWMVMHDVPFVREAPWQGGKKYVLDECPFCAGADGSAYIAWRSDGAVCAGCHHNSCRDKKWPDFRQHFEPGYGARSRATNVAVEGRTASKTPPPFPELEPEALYGIPGDFVRLVEPHTEADPAGLLATFLVAWGNAIGGGPYLRIGADRHLLKLFIVLVGRTGKGRKGMTWGFVRDLLHLVDPDWESHRIAGGMVSGEGIIYHVRDAVFGVNKKGEEILVDPGIEDKRLLVLETEFASVLKVATREGNTLSPVVRQMWDDQVLQTLAKNSPIRATGSHVSVVAHISKEELRRRTSDTEIANGFTNRFCHIMVRRSKELSEGGEFSKVDTAPLVRRMRSAYAFAKGTGEIVWGESAREVWREVYGPLSEEKAGLFGAAVGRAEAQVVRLAALHAVLDESRTIEHEHLVAALAFWEYAEASARHVFGDATGDEVADRVLDALQLAEGRGLTRTEISGLFKRHKSSDRLEQSLRFLLETGRARRETVDTGGRPTERWVAT